MLISVIITTFQRPKLLKRAINSVFQQATSSSYQVELLVSDDDPLGSGVAGIDSDILLKAKDFAFKYIKRKHGPGGVAISRNRALAMANGEWIVFLDDDDALCDGALNNLLSKAIIDRSDFCAGGYSVISEKESGELVEKKEFQPDYNSFDQLLLGNLFPIGSFIIKKDAIISGFSPNLKTHEDWLFLLDNLCDAKISVLYESVLQVFQTIDGSRDHRNEAGGRAQRAADFFRIYGLHPAPHLLKHRKKILSVLGYQHPDAIIGGTIASHDGEIYVHEAVIGKFVICNPLEITQLSLIRDGLFESLPAKIAIAFAEKFHGVIVDIGANMGIFSVHVGRELPESIILSIEPKRMVFMQLCANLLINKLVNVYPMNFSIGPSLTHETTVPIPFFDIFKEIRTGAVSIDGEAQIIRGEISGVADSSKLANNFDVVPLRALDSIVCDHVVSFVKVDLDGFEFQVFKSGEKLLINQKPFLFFKSWSSPEFEVQKNLLLSYLMGIGYSFFEIKESYFAYHPDVVEGCEVLEILKAVGLVLNNS